MKTSEMQLSYYYQNGFYNVTEEEEMEIVRYIQENGKKCRYPIQGAAAGRSSRS